MNGEIWLKKMSKKEEYLKKIYYDPSHPASYEGEQNLYEAIRKEGKYNISHSQLKKWMQNQDIYSLNKSVKRNFQRGRVIVSGIDDQWDADLASLIREADQNDDYKYLLVVIDIFSRYGWVRPIKNKKPNEIIRAFNDILAEGRKPRRLRTDAAKDFTSKEFQANLTDKGIAHFTTHSEKQANYVERFIKTIKTKIWKHIVNTNSKRYIDILPQLIQSYNKSWHSGILMEPINVNKNNESKLWWQMYYPKEKDTKKGKKFIDIKPFAFEVGDKVRISYTGNKFTRAYDIKWSGEIFKISKRFLRQGQPIYRLVDWFNKPVKGTFYQKELQGVDIKEDNIFKIDHIVKYRGRGRNREAKIRWLNWPKKFDSWVPVSEIQDYLKK